MPRGKARTAQLLAGAPGRVQDEMSRTDGHAQSTVPRRQTQRRAQLIRADGGGGGGHPRGGGAEREPPGCRDALSSPGGGRGCKMHQDRAFAAIKS